MFWIKINKAKIQLPDDFRVELIIENPLFLQDRIPLPYTTSFDIILSPYNKKLLAQPSRINKKTHSYFYDAELGYGPFKIYDGSLITREIAGRISANFEAANDLDALRKPMSEVDLGDVEYGFHLEFLRSYVDMRLDPWFDINQPNAIFYDIPAFNLKNDWADARDDEREYTGAPIRVKGDIPTVMTDDGVIVISSIASATLFFNVWTPLFGNIAPAKVDLDLVTVLEYAHSPMYPQIRAAYFLFKLLGIPDEENPFRDGELNKLVITSHFHKNFRDDIISKWKGLLVDNDFPETGDPDQNLFIRLRSFMPTLQSNEMLKALLNLVCATMFRTKSGFAIKLNKDLISDGTFEDWDKILASRPALSREDAQVYGYGYENFDETPIVPDPEFILTNISDLIDAPINEETREQLYYITTTRQTILKRLAPKVDDTDPDEFIYESRDSGIGGSSGDSGYRISVAFSPMKMEPVVVTDNFNTSTIADKVYSYLPVYEGSRAADYRPHFMLYQGMQEDPFYLDLLYPYLSYHNYAPDGTRLGDLSLAWDGPDGLIENYHKEFKAWIESDRLTMYGLFIFSPNRIRELDLSKKVNVRNKLWWVKKMVIPMTKKKIEPAQVDLVDAKVPDISTGGSGSAGGGI